MNHPPRRLPLSLLPVAVMLAATAPLISADAADRTLRFPEDRSLGQLYSRLPVEDREGGRWNKYDGWEELGNAHGVVRIPGGHEVRLDVAVAAARDLSPLSGLPHDAFVYLNLDDSEVNDEQLVHVGKLTGLISLSMESVRITDRGFRHLTRLHQLRNIDMDAYGVRDEEFGPGDGAAEVLSKLQSLEGVNFRRGPLTDAGLAHLAQMKSLKSLEVSGTKITDVGLKMLRRTKALQSVSLGIYREGCPVTDEGMKHLAELPLLSWLRLDGTPLTDKGLAEICRLKHLRALYLGNTKVTPRGIDRLAELKELEIIDLPFHHTDQSLAVISQLKSLRRIRGSLDGISNDGFRLLSELPNLEFMDVESEQITDEGLQSISRMTSLKYLWLRSPLLTDAGFEHLRNLKNLQMLAVNLPRFRGPGLAALAGLRHLTELRLTIESDEEWNLPESAKPVDLSSLSRLQQLTELTLVGDRVSRDHIGGVFDLVRLKSLIFGFPLNDLDAERLSQISTLERLQYESSENAGTEITDAGLDHLSRLMRLQDLNLVGLFTDEGLQHLQKLRDLQSVSLGSPFLSDTALADLKNNLPVLSSFYRRRIGRDPATLSHIRNVLPKLDDPEIVLQQLDGIGLTINPDDLLFRDGTRKKTQGSVSLEGHASPALNLQNWRNSGDKPVTLESLKGHVVLVQFWHPRRRSCTEYMPRLKALKARFGEHGLRLLSVQHPDEDRVAAPRPEMDWPCVVDTERRTVEAWNTEGYSCYVLIDHKGIVRFADLHQMDLQRAVQRLILESRRDKRDSDKTSR